MFKTIYQSVAVFLTPLFLLTTIVFICISAYRAEVIVQLQSSLLAQKAQDVNVVIKQIKDVNDVGTEYSDYQKSQEVIKHERVITVDKIVQVPVFTTECISADGLQFYNSTYASTATVNPASEPN